MFTTTDALSAFGRQMWAFAQMVSQVLTAHGLLFRSMQRRKDRGPKLARRLRRNAQLGRAGGF